MSCLKCSNGKYKYGERGRCQFDTKAACEAAERAIHTDKFKDSVANTKQDKKTNKST